MVAEGRLAPPAPWSHNFQVWLCASFCLLQKMYITIGYQNLQTRMTPIVQVETTWKKRKVPTLPQKSQKLKVIGKIEIHAVGYSTHQQLEKNNLKKSRTNEGDFWCGPKKTNNAKKCAMEFSQINFWLVHLIAR